MSTPLARLADRVAGLRWDPHDPSRFLGERSDLARLLRLEAAAASVPSSPVAVRVETRDRPETLRTLLRLRALLAARDREIDALRRLLAEVARARPRRRRPVNAGCDQLHLPLMEVTDDRA